MSKYYQNEFFYDSAKIRHINKLCHRYANNRLWDNEETTVEDDGNIIEDSPPISTYDIALLQVALSQEVDFVFDDKPVVASFSVDWKSDYGDFAHHVVRFDLEGHNMDLSRLTEQELADRNKETERMRGVIDVFFDRIASTCTTHHLGRLNLPLEMTLFGIPDDLHYRSAKVKLPEGFGTLFLTLASSVDDDNDEGHGKFTTKEVIDSIVRHFADFGPQKKVSLPSNNSLEALILSNKPLTALSNVGIISISRLVRCYEAGLLYQIRGISKEQASEIEKTLISHGIPKVYRQPSAGKKMGYSEIHNLIPELPEDRQ